MSNVDVKALIRSITEEVMRKTAQNVQEKIYRDEPLIFTASQMKSYVPDEIKQMRKIAREPSSYYQTEAQIFCRQAKFMENYEDDFEYTENFLSYYTTYQKLNDNQLRGYFSWRTKVRRGEIGKTSLSFVYLYIYELINMTGSDSAKEVFRKFRDFCEAYSKLDPAVLRYVRTWLVDFAVYYNIDKNLLDGLVDTEFDRHMAVLRNYENSSEKEIFSAISAVSSYNIENSKLYKLCPDDVRNIVCGVFGKCSEYYQKNRSKSFCDKLFGRTVEMYYQIFESAVFYDRKKYSDYTYEITDFHKYFCKNGRWSCERFYGNKKSKLLGDILKSIDSVMRQKLDLCKPINSPCETKWILGIINKEIDSFVEYKNKNAAPEIEIDVSKLAGIRKAADMTRERLLTEEERGVPAGNSEEFPEIPDDAAILGTEEFFPDEIPEIPGAVTFFGSEETVPAEAVEIPEIIENSPIVKEIPTKKNSHLDENEYAFLHALLYGGSFSGKGMPSILSDSINEKLFDEFGDVVIEFEGDKPVVIEDYADDLKGMIPE